MYFRLVFLLCLDKIVLGWKEIDKTKKRPDSFLLKHKSHSQLLLINVSPLFSLLQLHYTSSGIHVVRKQRILTTSAWVTQCVPLQYSASTMLSVLPTKFFIKYLWMCMTTTIILTTCSPTQSLLLSTKVTTY